MGKKYIELENGEVVDEPLETELQKWIGIIDRHPEIYQGEINDLPLVPKHLLPKLAEKFISVKKYINKPKIEIDNEEISELCNEYPAAAIQLRKWIKKKLGYFNENPFYEQSRVLIYDSIKKGITFINSNFKEKEINKENIKKESIELSGDDSLISNFAENLTKRLAKENSLFYRQDSRQIIELGDIKNEQNEVTHTGFILVNSSRFSTLIEKYFIPWTWKNTKSGSKYRVNKSMTKTDGSLVLESHILQEGLPSINRIFTTQIPILYNGELTFPKLGYDKRFCSWLPIESASISNMEMPLKEAKKVIRDIFKEFCFETEQDYFNAISAFITPFLRGLFETGFNTRAPVYCYEANRERSGKDYLAGVTGMLYEGNALEEPPISSGEYRTTGGSDELRKKLISAMMSGKKRLHFSNNKGHLNNAVFESVTTASRFTDRLLGKNIEVAFDNEMDFSFSGNLGITLTPDLTNRTIFIKLFLDIEDANKRKFDNPNLHGWVLDNRDIILSALYSLVRNWFDNDCPDGKVPFTSFPEWARVCGGIMECADYGNPCKRIREETGISIDSETDDMKELFELCFEQYPNTPINKHEIKNLIINNNIMSYLQWDNKSTQTKFGIKLNKFIGRILSDIRMTVQDKSIRSTRWKYIFSKVMKNEGKKWSF